MSQSKPRREDRTNEDQQEAGKELDEVSQSPAARKDPDRWVTGGESMTPAQASYLKTLAQEAGETVDPEMTKAEASKKIEQLQEETGRGIDH
jgi:hypothetical protein